MTGFCEYLPELFADFGPVAMRRMFGGTGIYHQGTLFAFVVDDVLYLRGDERSAEHFLSRGLTRFEYSRGGKKVPLSYYRAPDEMLDDPSEAVIWARRAWESAQRMVAARAGGKKRRRKGD
jgi:DNA transformation protein